MADVIVVEADVGASGADSLQVEIEGRSGTSVVPLQAGRMDATLQTGTADAVVIEGGPPGKPGIRGPQGPQGDPGAWAQDVIHPVTHQGPFQLSAVPVPFSEHGTLNGYTLVSGMDYTLGGSTIWILPALGCTLSPSDVLVFSYQKAGV